MRQFNSTADYATIPLREKHIYYVILVIHMQKESLVVRKVDKRVYRKFRQKAFEEETNIGDAVTEAMRYWLEAKQKIKRANVKNLLKLKSLIKVGKRVRWSQQIDEVLYGR